MTDSQPGYYLPEPSRWPIIGAFGMALFFSGFAMMINDVSLGGVAMLAGFATILAMVFAWFGKVIIESQGGHYNSQVDMSFRWGMGWFIFSEVMFFAAFFGALFYARVYSVPWLGGAGSKEFTSTLWPAFEAVWPLLHVPDASKFTETVKPMETWGLPAINTLVLLSSGWWVTWAHWGLKKNERKQLIIGLVLTVSLGALFLVLQGIEYSHAYHELNLKMTSGIYGATFFMLTGFHGAHVTLGTIMLLVVLIRSIKGHFTPENHFAFEAAAWYWHFVDVVWLGLFVFVYWI